MTPRRFAVNLGGEGEVPGVLNQQPPLALSASWFSMTRGNRGKTIQQLAAGGRAFLICPNEKLSFPSESVDVVYTNNVPLDGRPTYLGPTLQSSEIRRILTVGGIWIHNGRVRWRKP